MYRGPEVIFFNFELLIEDEDEGESLSFKRLLRPKSLNTLSIMVLEYSEIKSSSSSGSSSSTFT